MAELTANEISIIRTCFIHGFHFKYPVESVLLSIDNLSWKHDFHHLIDSLIKKKVLSRSPDGAYLKFTDYGVELVSAFEHEQNEWESASIIKVKLLDHDQTLIRASERWRPPSCGKEKWRILPVGEVHDQHAACQGGHRRNAPWGRVSASQSERMSLSLSR